MGTLSVSLYDKRLLSAYEVATFNYSPATILKSLTITCMWCSKLQKPLTLNQTVWILQQWLYIVVKEQSLQIGYTLGKCWRDNKMVAGLQVVFCVCVINKTWLSTYCRFQLQLLNLTMLYCIHIQPWSTVKLPSLLIIKLYMKSADGTSTLTGQHIPTSTDLLDR